MRIKYIFLHLICVCVLNACGSASIRQHRDFNKIFPKYRTVTILPVEISIERQTKKGAEFIVPDQARINNIKNDARQELSDKGYIVTDGESVNDEVPYKFKRKYKESVEGLYGNPAFSRQDKAFSTNESLGGLVNEVAQKSNADLLFVLSYSGHEMAQEVIAKNLARDVSWAAIGVQNDSHVKEGVAIGSFIDRKSGKLLWTNSGLDFETYGESVIRALTKKNVMETAFKNVFKTIPNKKE